ncbi:hypothetical protein [Marinicella sp. W31]|uniref:hypothetical protein n=1 Tax=Marinicella sp. W31 TaxID=3023713 RepID=UPI003756B355
MLNKYNTHTAVWTLLVTLGLGMLSNAYAQDEEFEEKLVVPLSSPDKPGRLTVSQIYGGVRVIGHSGQDVIVLARKKNFKQKTEMKNGLRKVNNDSMKLVIEERDNHVDVVSQHYSGKKPALNLEIRVPFKFDIKLSNINKGDSYVRDVTGEMEISNVNGSITLENISGGVLADSVNGAVTATFESVFENTDMAFSSLNKDVDITLPKNVKAKIKAKTENGEIYTGFDVDFDKSPAVVEKESGKGSYKLKLEKWVQGTINGGGAEIQLKTLNGDIIIRAAE